MLKIKYNFIKYFNLAIFIASFNLVLLKKPVIGMYGLVEPISDYNQYNKEAIDGGFVRWMEAAGADIVMNKLYLY